MTLTRFFRIFLAGGNCGVDDADARTWRKRSSPRRKTSRSFISSRPLQTPRRRRKRLPPEHERQFHDRTGTDQTASVPRSPGDSDTRGAESSRAIKGGSMGRVDPERLHQSDRARPRRASRRRDDCVPVVQHRAHRHAGADRRLPLRDRRPGHRDAVGEMDNPRLHRQEHSLHSRIQPDAAVQTRRRHRSRRSPKPHNRRPKRPDREHAATTALAAEVRIRPEASF